MKINPIKELFRTACAESGIPFVEIKRMNYPPRKGLFVRVYQDPFTAQKLEGIAQLVDKIDGDDEIERWSVRFVTGKNDMETETYERLFVRPFVANTTFQEAML